MRDRLSWSLATGLASLALTSACLPAVAAGKAEEGLVFDWGDNDKTVDSGKAHVRFNGGAKPGDIIVSFGDRKLYHIVAPGEADTYPIAIPREQSRWEGVTSVSQKRENPSWTPTAHMLSENPKLPLWVPGGHPMNPLGIRALYLGSSDYRIHGTDAPWTIGTPASKGCVRMFNKDVADLYPQVKVGTKVTVTWQKFDGKTLALTGHEPAKGIVEPDAKTGKAALASFTPENTAPQDQVKKPLAPMVQDDSEAASAQAPAPAAELATKKRKSRQHTSDETSANQDEKSNDTADTAAASPAGQPPAPPVELVVKKRKSRPYSPEASDQSEKATEKSQVETAAAASVPAASDTASEHPRRRVRSHVKTPAESTVETGSIAKSAAEKHDHSAALALAERAMAAAERAAQAAERAAAAAERAVAASQPPAPVTVPPSATATATTGETSAH